MPARGKEHVEPAHGRVVPAALVELGNVGLALPRDFLVAELAGIRRGAFARLQELHVAVVVVEVLVANHHAAHRLLHEVVAEECLDLFSTLARVRRYGQCADVENRVRMAFYGNVVDTDGAIPYGNRVLAGTHLGRCRHHVAGIAVARGREHRARLDTVHENLGGRPVVLLDEHLCRDVVHRGFFDIHREGELGPGGFRHELRSGRICRNVAGIYARLCFGFVDCGGGKSGYRHGECGCRRERPEFHKHSIHFML